MIARALLAASSAFLIACEPAADGPESNFPSVVPAPRDRVAPAPHTPVSSDDPVVVDTGSGAAPGNSAGSDCDIVQSSDWSAWVNAMPGPGARRTLHVNGTVQLPSAGHRAVLKLGPIAESHPLMVTVLLEVTPPTGGAAEVVTDVRVKGSWPIEGDVGSVTIRCGGRTVGRISPVESAY